MSSEILLLKINKLVNKIGLFSDVIRNFNDVTSSG